MIIILMGVSGSGKTTIGKLLANSLDWEFSDADAFHSLENVEKMRCGIPLTEADRIPWLQDLQTAIQNWLQENKNMVLACSALKQSYRQFLVVDSDGFANAKGERFSWFGLPDIQRVLYAACVTRLASRLSKSGELHQVCGINAVSQC